MDRLSNTSDCLRVRTTINFGRNKLMTLLTSKKALATLVAGVFLTLSTGIALAGPITLNMVGAWPPKISAAADVGIRFIEEVN